MDINAGAYTTLLAQLDDLRATIDAMVKPRNETPDIEAIRKLLTQDYLTNDTLHGIANRLLAYIDKMTFLMKEST